MAVCPAGLRSIAGYLFIDEAGQVSLANVVAMGVSARNIVLVGDQMQLGQPIQGVHPGTLAIGIGVSVLGDIATVPPIGASFLPVTRRMHPGRVPVHFARSLRGASIAGDRQCIQRIVLSGGADPAFKASGLVGPRGARGLRSEESRKRGLALRSSTRAC